MLCFNKMISKRDQRASCRALAQTVSVELVSTDQDVTLNLLSAALIVK
jgi:hypothetical protein